MYQTGKYHTTVTTKKIGNNFTNLKAVVKAGGALPRLHPIQHFPSLAHWWKHALHERPCFTGLCDISRYYSWAYLSSDVALRNLTSPACTYTHTPDTHNLADQRLPTSSSSSGRGRVARWFSVLHQCTAFPLRPFFRSMGLNPSKVRLNGTAIYHNQWSCNAYKRKSPTNVKHI